MKPFDRRNEFPIQVDARRCTVPPAEIDKMHSGAQSLARSVAHFPVAGLHVLIEHNARSGDYSVKTDLFLCGETLVCREQNVLLYTAFERCIHSLVADVQAYKDRLGRVPERQKTEKATHQALSPTAPPDMTAIDAAVREGDYAAFRTGTFPYEEPVRKRAGRWVERYPQADAQIDGRLKIADIVEEIFLDAFEGYERRPAGIRFGDWLEALIDPAVKELLKRPDAELQNIDLARSALAAELGGEAV